MIKHIVMFKLSENTESRMKDENIDLMNQKFNDLVKEIKTVLNPEFVVNDKKADITNYDVALIMNFETIEALNAYQIHPAHIAFGEFVAKIRESRACIDYVID